MANNGHYLCDDCKSIFDKFRVLYDSTPAGDDQYVCPCCGSEEFEWVKETKDNE